MTNTTKPLPIIEAPPILEALPLLEAPSGMVDVRNILEAPLIWEKFLKVFETFISIFTVQTVKTRKFWMKNSFYCYLQPWKS